MIEINEGVQQFEKEVLHADQLVIVDFWAPWCGPCKVIAPILEELQDEAKIVKVNVDDNPALASEYGIRSIPTLLYFNGGYQVGKSIGMQSKHILQAKIDELKKI